MKIKLLLTTCLVVTALTLTAQIKVPPKIIGNWINEQSNNWQYGFFEDFAIIDSEFWNYELIQAKESRIELQLRNGKRIEKLAISISANDSSLSIARGKQAPAIHRMSCAIFTPYSNVDEKPFKNAGFRLDTVTITGYLRNLNKYVKAEGGSDARAPFSVSVYDFISKETINHYGDIDSIGRFKIQFPIYHTQEVFVDWGRLTFVDVFEPGEKIFLYADMTNHIMPKDLNEEVVKAFFSKPRQLMFMGENARFHTELAWYESSLTQFDRRKLEVVDTPDPQYLAIADSIHKIRILHLENYLISVPTLTKRFRDYRLDYEKYKLTFDLLQHRFHKFSKRDYRFDKGYVEYVDSVLDFHTGSTLVLQTNMGRSLTDYLGYRLSVPTAPKDTDSIKLVPGGRLIADNEPFQVMLDAGFFSGSEKEMVIEYVKARLDLKMLNESKDTAKNIEILNQYQKSFEDMETLRERPDVNKRFLDISAEYSRSIIQKIELEQIDLNFRNEDIKELLTAGVLYQNLNQSRIPLLGASIDLMKERISNHAIRQYLLAENDKYIAVEKKEIQYVGSLQNTDHLREAKNADSLFKHIMAPYKGKVVYVDFWGTWCSPCLQQMPFASTLKKELAGKDVVFMYLANNSPDKTWKNVIKQMELSGENVVHYNLPPEQQAMIERKFSVNSFPTYMLFDKKGALVNNKAHRPEAKKDLMNEINELLQ